MKLSFDIQGKHQPDPFIFEDNGVFYLYVTATDGVEAYSSVSLTGTWKYEGVVAKIRARYDYWAPSVIKIGDRYYMYVSSSTDSEFQHMHVLSADSPLGEFGDAVKLYDFFSIDSHAVMTEEGLFLYFSADKTEGERVGTRIFVDRLITPTKPEGKPREVIPPTLDEEIFMRDRFKPGEDWHTVEGAFWFREGEWQYLMYSGGCFENDTYHIGYASCHTDSGDLYNVDFVKHTEEGRFAPVIKGNEFEEGTGHHSVIKHGGEYYAIYHGRDITEKASDGYTEQRVARICKLTVNDGRITAHRYPDKL